MQHGYCCMRRRGGLSMPVHPPRFAREGCDHRVYTEAPPWLSDEHGGPVSQGLTDTLSTQRRVYARLVRPSVRTRRRGGQSIVAHSPPWMHHTEVQCHTPCGVSRCLISLGLPRRLFVSPGSRRIRTRLAYLSNTPPKVKTQPRRRDGETSLTRPDARRGLQCHAPCRVPRLVPVVNLEAHIPAQPTEAVPQIIITHGDAECAPLWSLTWHTHGPRCPHGCRSSSHVCRVCVAADLSCAARSLRPVARTHHTRCYVPRMTVVSSMRYRAAVALANAHNPDARTDLSVHAVRSSRFGRGQFGADGASHAYTRVTAYGLCAS
jgi:hypothetical protein